jgi:hypothetical protein
MLAGMETELAQRENDGIAVTLLWHSTTDRLTVTVRDWRTGEAFELDAHARNAMDVFHHPYAYAYAARRGLLPVDAGEPVYA